MNCPVYYDISIKNLKFIISLDSEHHLSGNWKISEEWRYQKCKEIYRKLENEYNYLISEETIKLNNYEFDEKGNLV